MSNNEATFQIGIADPCYFFRRGMVETLKSYDDFTIAFETGNLQACYSLLSDKPNTNILILALDSIKQDIASFIQHLTEINPYLNTIGIVSSTESGSIQYFIESGINGLLHRHDPIKEIENGLEKLQQEHFYCSTNLSLDLHYFIKDRDRHNATVKNLNEEEISLLQYICQGMTNKEISKYICLNHRSIENHRKKLKKKLNCSYNVELAVFAAKQGLV